MPGSLTQDLRYAARQLRANPGFATVAVVSLALGVAANSAIFQLVDAVRLRTLPVTNPQDLVTIDFAKHSSRSGNWSTRSARLTSVLWDQVRGLTEPFAATIAWSATRFNLAPGGEARYAEGQYVSGDFFRVLGVQPWMGEGSDWQAEPLLCHTGRELIPQGKRWYSQRISSKPRWRIRDGPGLRRISAQRPPKRLNTPLKLPDGAARGASGHGGVRT